jgi:hypothetical protein
VNLPPPPPPPPPTWSQNIGKRWRSVREVVWSGTD